jgi:uncharacterized protein (TIGR02145 family)
MNRLFTAISIAIALMFFSSCDEAGGGKSALVGRWDLIDGGEYRYGVLIADIKDMELLSDGTGIVDEAGITYKTESGRFYLTHPLMAVSYSYKVSGSMLTLTKDDGTILTYIDVKKIKPPSFANFTDSRNGKVYKTVKMSDGKVWFAENLNYASEGSKCYVDRVYKNKEENCQKSGRLYDWATAMKVCPKGWHLPSEEEWGYGTPAMDKHLKAKEGWVEGESGTDPFGFAAIPGGFGDSEGSFGDIIDSGHWWSSTDSDNSHAYGRSMGHSFSSTESGRMGYSNNIWLRYGKSFLLSVRCVKD